MDEKQINKVIEELTAYLECKKRANSGIDEDYNSDMCLECELCYMQGNNGEHIKDVETAIECMKKQILKTPDYEGDGYKNYKRGNLYEKNSV